MQEVFNRLASLICEQNPHLSRLLDGIELEKKERQIKQVTRTDAESIFELIETANPFETEEDIEEEDEHID
jgi:hypothetical protein